MHSKSDNIEIVINDKAGDVIEEHFQSLLYRWEIGLETLMKDSRVIFDHLHLLYYKSHKINPSLAVSYVNSPDTMKNEKATINPINKNGNKCFQYAATSTSNNGEIGTFRKKNKN